MKMMRPVGAGGTYVKEVVEVGAEVEEEEAETERRRCGRVALRVL